MLGRPALASHHCQRLLAPIYDRLGFQQHSGSREWFSHSYGSHLSGVTAAKMQWRSTCVRTWKFKPQNMDLLSRWQSSKARISMALAWDFAIWPKCRLMNQEAQLGRFWHSQDLWKGRVELFPFPKLAADWEGNLSTILCFPRILLKAMLCMSFVRCCTSDVVQHGSPSTPALLTWATKTKCRFTFPNSLVRSWNGLFRLWACEGRGGRRAHQGEKGADSAEMDGAWGAEGAKSEEHSTAPSLHVWFCSDAACKWTRQARQNNSFFSATRPCVRLVPLPSRILFANDVRRTRGGGVKASHMRINIMRVVFTCTENTSTCHKGPACG